MTLSIENCGKLRLFLLVWILTFTLYKIADCQNFELTTRRTRWEDLKESCNTAANVSLLFCSKNNEDDTSCDVRRINSIDTTNLPDTFSAWINAYLVRSFSIVYEGCYQLDPKSLTSIECNTTDLTECARKCKHSKLGIQENNSFSISDNDLVHDNIHNTKIPEESCHSENSGNELEIKVYDIKKHVILDKDLCPVGYSLSIQNIFVGEEDCQIHKKFYCYGSTAVERNEMSWYDAQKFCMNISSRLINKWEFSSATQKQYWLQRLHYNYFDINTPLPLFPTRCAALIRQRKVYSIELFNCSMELYTLCRTKHAPTDTWPVSVSIIIPVVVAAVIIILAIIVGVIICVRRRRNAGNAPFQSPEREHTTLINVQRSGQSSPNTDTGGESVELQSHN
ncbi:uncharacterized protein LOC127729486 isoform X2 [Mytilus californianus]|uniref:uncharacterized protein LOC127729486 isoform X2 n=1 Tax=Mytilus californianus TaxID=6549 RepID=UPI002245DABA|nr:uncharacterized protein LOC127729486 isoform X2 [Mytilus californianus]